VPDLIIAAATADLSGPAVLQLERMTGIEPACQLGKVGCTYNALCQATCAFSPTGPDLNCPLILYVC